uniref:Uncharacterized protein n=1 Tax=Panagrolaimus sp. PS1159 TaxID=55785 RepID=A0AC35GDR7_9BILA
MNWKKNDNSAKNDSTLSLHIEVYENLFEANLFGDKIDETLKSYDSIKNGKNTKQSIFPDLAMIIQVILK